MNLTFSDIKCFQLSIQSATREHAHSHIGHTLSRIGHAQSLNNEGPLVAGAEIKGRRRKHCRMIRRRESGEDFLNWLIIVPPDVAGRNIKYSAGGAVHAAQVVGVVSDQVQNASLVRFGGHDEGGLSQFCQRYDEGGLTCRGEVRVTLYERYKSEEDNNPNS